MANSIQSRIEDWWQQFAERAPRIDGLFKGQEEWDLPQWMEEKLQAIDADLMWEFGPAVKSPGHRLVITSESRHDLRPLVREILGQAPEIEGWEFYEYRLPEDFSQAECTVQGRTGGEIDDVQVQAAVGEFNRIDLLFSCSRFAEGDRAAFNTAFVATESLLGEELLNQWVGAIEVAREPAATEIQPASIRELLALVTERIDEAREALPAHPFCQLDNEEGWSVFELKPDETAEYPQQQDLLVGTTLIPDMWGNALSGCAFHSARFSRWDERFCYLKIDGTEGLEGTAFADRGEIEDAMNERLRTECLGSVVGGGTGLQYSYIELALTDFDAAWPIIRSTLQAGNLPRRTWLQFHDDDLQTTWYGLWDDTVPPPLPENVMSYRGDV